MSKNITIAALSAVIFLGMSSQASAQSSTDTKMIQQKTMTNLTQEMPKGFEKCYGIAKAGKNDCASGTEACAGQAKNDNDKSAWLGLPKGTCGKIVGGSTTEG